MGMGMGMRMRMRRYRRRHSDCADHRLDLPSPPLLRSPVLWVWLLPASIPALLRRLLPASTGITIIIATMGTSIGITGIGEETGLANEVERQVSE
jgi:hypothetical protein